MKNLWKFLEEEKNGAQKAQDKEERKRVVKNQYKNVLKEFEEAYYTLQANYIFNYFLTDIFPKYIKELIENNHEASLQGNNIIGNISLSLKEKYDFERERYMLDFYTKNNYIYKAMKNYITIDNYYSTFYYDTLVYYIDANNAMFSFMEPVIFEVFKEKLNIFLIKNNIISINAPKDNNLISYANPIHFEAKIENLIKAYENGLQQIEDEKETLNALMDIWEIYETDIKSNIIEAYSKRPPKKLVRNKKIK